MDKVIFSYIRTHTVLILSFFISAFLLLAVGEFILYKNVMKLNQMLSEGLIQIKESNKTEDVEKVPTILPQFRLPPTPETIPNK